MSLPAGSRVFFPALIGLALTGLVVGQPPDDEIHQGIDATRTQVSFGRDVQPILASRCFVCHGFDESSRALGLRLDLREEATSVRGRRPAAIVPGEPDASLVIERIEALDASHRMPPDGPPLEPEEIELIRRWIAEGAPYEQHWSLRPLEKPSDPVPEDPSWRQHLVDRHIAARLEEAGLSPAAPADRAALARRLSFDLTGLPPSPDVIGRFTSSEDPRAYEELVDQLLASPRFGERWARHWLDLMRYAETHGHEFDYPIAYAWEYRDYVIRAINADVPYDQFVTEHIAGDLMPQPRKHPDLDMNESIIGTGWWFMSQGTHAPVDVRQDEAERVDNQIDVLSKTFLATTVSCARCHDHKFDPVTAEDYYALAGYVQSSRRQIAYLDPGGRIRQGQDSLEQIMDHIETATQRPRSGVGQIVAAAVEVLVGVPEDGEQPGERGPLIIEEFESDSYTGWAVEGTAFGDGPRTPTSLARYQGKVGASGDGLVNTHETRGGESMRAADEHIGELTSGPFTVERDWITFLIGGGNHPGRTCLELLVDGEVIRTATGRNSNEMRLDGFDVSQLQGRSVQLRIADREAGGWGNIGIDRIIQTDTPPGTRPLSRSIDVVARETGVDPVVLRRWVNAQRTGDGWFADLAAIGTRKEADGVAGETVALDGWFASGAVDASPAQVGDLWLLDGRVCVLDRRALHTGLSGSALQGTLRSPTFEITQPWLLYRARGENARIRIIIDGYYLNEHNQLLFEGLLSDVASSDSWSTFAHDVSAYVGHRAYVELIDDGDGFIAVDRIELSQVRELASGAVAPRPELDLAGGRALAERIEERVDAAAADWKAGTLQPVDARGIDRLMSLGFFESTETQAMLADHDALQAGLPRPRRALALEDGTPENEYIFVRGSHRDRGPVAPRRFVSVLGGEKSSSDGSGRLELAQALLHERNPLPARVQVNRVWHHLMGRGLVTTTDDFGVLGEAPSHPELLDALAYWFRNDGDWSTKSLIRMIVTSKTYQQSSSVADTRWRDVDPDNRLLSHANVRRLQAEPIRDAMLVVSGRLNQDMYGRSVPLHLTPFLSGRGRPGKSGPLDGDGRRSVYLEVRRNFLNPMMTVFDAPIPSTTVGRRATSNVPAQSLLLMNDPFVVEQARVWAERVLAEGRAPLERVRSLYRSALGREPTAVEAAEALEFVAASSSEGASEQAAWASLCHLVFNLKEFIFLR